MLLMLTDNSRYWQSMKQFIILHCLFVVQHISFHGVAVQGHAIGGHDQGKTAATAKLNIKIAKKWIASKVCKNRRMSEIFL